ncbi:hypothetical protein ZWY2020_014563 [Hordeum vulgare]|nr:hypothetical protein ZWY2020_014563 [Hordeum vulgare]
MRSKHQVTVFGSGHGGRMGIPHTTTTSSVPSLPTEPRATSSRRTGAARRRKATTLTVEAATSKPNPSSPARENRVNPRRPLHQRLHGEPTAPSEGDEGDEEEGKARGD